MVSFALTKEIMGCEMYVFKWVNLRLLRRINERPSKHNEMFEFNFFTICTTYKFTVVISSFHAHGMMVSHGKTFTCSSRPTLSSFQHSRRNNKSFFLRLLEGERSTNKLTVVKAEISRWPTRWIGKKTFMYLLNSL